MKFKKWLENLNTLNNDLVDDSQINRVYDKAKIAVDIVRMYSKENNKKILNNISTIANLASGAYGLYNSKYNKKIISQSAIQKIRFKFGDDIIKNNQIHNIPEIVIRRYIPEIRDEDIVPSDVIFVNVSRFVREFGDSIETIFHIASTIVHESSHEREREETAQTSEFNMVKKEVDLFEAWFVKNKDRILAKYPLLRKA
jgi:hypothetical protein